MRSALSDLVLITVRSFGEACSTMLTLILYDVLLTVKARLGMSVTTQGGSGRQCVTGSRRNISKYGFVLLNVYRSRET